MDKRFLKKQIAYTCGELAAATIFERDFVEGVDFEAANALIGKIADFQCDTIRRCSFSFDKAPQDFADRREYRRELSAYNKAAYHKIHEDFNKGVADIVKSMNDLVPADRRKELLGTVL